MQSVHCVKASAEITPRVRITFLALEDDANDAVLIRRAFTNGCCRAFVCRNTSEARAYLLGAGMYADRERFPFPDVFVSDLRLGDESGIHFIDWLRGHEHFRRLPVIVLSGALTPQDLRTAKMLGAAKIVQKPSDPTELQYLLVSIAHQISENIAKSLGRS